MSRERTFRTEAIVLRRSDFGEADRLLTLYSRERGKIRAIAKGARKPQSRKTGHIELFMRSNLFLAQGRDLNIVTQAEMIEYYEGLRLELSRTSYAAYAVELLDRFTVDEDPHSGIYRLLAEALGWFADAADLLLAARYYELRLLSLAGFQPQLFRCVGSQEPIEEQDQFFSAELGGVLSPNFQHMDRRAKRITAVSLKVLRYLQTRDWQTVNALRLKTAVHQEIEAILQFYLTYILERDLKSVDFIYRLRRE